MNTIERQTEGEDVAAADGQQSRMRRMELDQEGVSRPESPNTAALLVRGL
jgi:hypothetical protein